VLLLTMNVSTFSCQKPKHILSTKSTKE